MAYDKTVSGVSSDVTLSRGGSTGRYLGEGEGRTSVLDKDTEYIKRAGYLETPKDTDLPATGGMSSYRFPSQEKIDTTSVDYASQFREGFMEPYGEIYYQDFLREMTDFYFEDVSAQDIGTELGISDVSGLGTEKAMLPEVLITELRSGSESPYRVLEESRETILEGFEGVEEGIEDEEAAITAAEDLYEEREKQFEMQKRTGIESGKADIIQRQGQYAQSGYEIGPAQQNINIAKEAMKVDLEGIQQSKRIAQGEKVGDIGRAENEIERLEGMGSDLWDDLAEAETAYTDAIGQFGSFATTINDVVSTAHSQLNVIDQATSNMFQSAYQRAEGEEAGGMGGGRGELSAFPYDQRHSIFQNKADVFKADMQEAQNNIYNLANYLPTAEQIGPDSSAYEQYRYFDIED